MSSYVTPELYMPSGERKSSEVVEIVDGVVKKIYSFSGEIHSMQYIPKIYLSALPGLKTEDEILLVPDVSADDAVYAYSADGSGGLIPLL